MGSHRTCAACSGHHLAYSRDGSGRSGHERTPRAAEAQLPDAGVTSGLRHSSPTFSTPNSADRYSNARSLLREPIAQDLLGPRWGAKRGANVARYRAMVADAQPESVQVNCPMIGTGIQLATGRLCLGVKGCGFKSRRPDDCATEVFAVARTAALGRREVRRRGRCRWPSGYRGSGAAAEHALPPRYCGAGAGYMSLSRCAHGTPTGCGRNSSRKSGELLNFCAEQIRVGVA